MSFKKRVKAPVEKSEGADINVVSNDENISRLLWFKGKINNQLFDMLLDCGASVCCIAKRCVTSNNVLKSLPKLSYDGPGLVDVNGNSLTAEGKIRTSLTVGTSGLSLYVDFVIVDGLPYSCIAGMNLLNKLQSWGVNNNSDILTLDSSSVKLYSEPQFMNQVNLLTCEKLSLLPGETKVIKTSAIGPAVEANRPITSSILFTEGFVDYEMRTSISIYPSLNVIGYKNNQMVTIAVKNLSLENRTIGKGTKIAQCYPDYVEISDRGGEFEVINSVSNSNMDPVKFMCKRENYSHLSNEEFEKLRLLLVRFQDVFSVSNEKIGRANNSEFHINVDAIQPISTPLRRVPLHKEMIVKKLLEHYEKLGLIEFIDSPFRAPTVLVEKKNVGNGAALTDKYRLCVDFRFLNDALVDSGWPTPSIEHCLDAAVGSVYLSSLDFNSGYHQIPCTSDAKETLAFSPGFGFPQYTWNVMPQGIKPAASCFQRSMEKTFQGLEQCILPPFYDDIMVKGTDFKTHLVNLELVLSRIRGCGYTLNALKCQFFRTKIKYLGYVIENGRISLDPERVDTICNFPVPSTVKALRRFLGMCQFCSRFIPNLNRELSSLHDLTRKNVPFVWTVECQKSFEYAKKKLLEPPVLCLPSVDDYFVLETDASNGGIGACLKAVSRSGREFLVAFYSSKLTETECKWNIVEKEAYAILKGVEKFRHYLIGKEFTLKTDNRILTYLKSTHTSKSRKLLNWALTLSEYDYTIQHIPSSSNQISDCLSRLYEKVYVISQFEFKITGDEFLKAQKEEEYIRESFNYLSCKNDFDINKLGTLKRFRKQLNINDKGLLCWNNKIVLPKVFQPEILRICHDHPTSGHFKEDRTWRIIWSNIIFGQGRTMTSSTGFVLVNVVINLILFLTFIGLYIRFRLKIASNLSAMIWLDHFCRKILVVIYMHLLW